jgi:phosphoribosylanthranilate isomerase
MNRVQIKICGVRSLEEAKAALTFGADALGFNFWPISARYISPEYAIEILDRLPELKYAVGVFVDEEESRIESIVRQLKLAAIQLHGNETPEFCTRFSSVRVIKALRVGANFDPRSVTEYPVDSILLDTEVKGSYGGTGRPFNWAMALEAKKYKPIILAGGLTIENVVDAIEYVRPPAIDVCSGVEAEPGRKDLDKLRRFIAEATNVNSLASEHFSNVLSSSTSMRRPFDI